MGWFFLALAASLFASTGGRDQRLIAHLSVALGPRAALLSAVVVACAVTAAAAAWIGSVITAGLPTKIAIAAAIVALAAASALLLWQRDWRSPAEPTHSLFAMAAVLGALQLFDPARLLIFSMAIGVGTASGTVLVALGGALGSIAALVSGWALREELDGSDLANQARFVFGCAVAAVAIWCVLVESGMV